MARARGRGLRIILGAILAIGLWLTWISTFGTPSAADALPSGAAAVIEVQDAAAIADRLAKTRFAAAFARSASREWLERTDAVLALDGLLAEVKRLTGISLGRRSVLDLVGTDAAGAWYLPGGEAPTARPWVIAGRLSLRGWAVVGALRLAERALGAEGVVREVSAGRGIYAVPTGSAPPLRLFVAGRVLVAASERDLALRAARALSGDDAPLARDPALRGIREALSSRGEVFLWARGGNPLPGEGFPGARVGRSTGGVLKVGPPLEIELAAEPPAIRRDAPGDSAELPALPLLKGGPLAFLSSRQRAPAPLVDLLQERLRTAAARRGGAAPPPVVPGRGFAVVLTESAGGSGLLPAPRGLVALGLRSDAEALAALPLLFPPGARSAAAGGVTALASRESIPLAGEFELWGAALGSNLAFATDTALLAAAAGTGGADARATAAILSSVSDWEIDTVAEVSMEKALPLLRRWGPPLSALLAARFPLAPDLTRDVDLAAAVRTVRAVVGSDGKRDRALVTLHLRDLP